MTLVNPPAPGGTPARFHRVGHLSRLLARRGNTRRTTRKRIRQLCPFRPQIVATTSETKARFARISPSVSKSCILVSIPWTISRKIADLRASCCAANCWRRAPSRARSASRSFHEADLLTSSDVASPEGGRPVLSVARYSLHCEPATKDHLSFRLQPAWYRSRLWFGA